MIALTLDEVAALAKGELRRATGASRVTGVVIDSRRVAPGDLFVAVGGGTVFADEALAHGAAAVLLPDDEHAALAALGRTVRERSEARMVAITGSTGKTSTKDILAAILSPHRRTVAAEASYNAELGVPLTLCRLEEDTEVCILEMAMRGLGQIAYLCEIAQPEIGVVTNTGPVHLELVGSLENVIRAKGELVDALPPGGTAIVPGGFPVTRDDLQVVRFGEPVARTDASRTLIHLDGRDVELSFTARHQARNALAALLTARALGLAPEGRIDVSLSRWRGEELRLPGEGLLIVDCWNANPMSMRAGLEHLAMRAGGRRRVAVLGTMAELGSDSPRFHREIGGLAAALPVDILIAVGESARDYLTGAAGQEWVSDAAGAAERIREVVEPGDCVLVKGSRSVGLELVAEALTAVTA